LSRATPTRNSEFAAKNQILVAGGFGEWTRDGAFLTYGPNTVEIMQRVAVFITKLLRGARPVAEQAGSLPSARNQHVLIGHCKSRQVARGYAGIPCRSAQSDTPRDAPHRTVWPTLTPPENSIERTSSSRLRLPRAVAHVKRQARQLALENTMRATLIAAVLALGSVKAVACDKYLVRVLAEPAAAKASQRKHRAKRKQAA
jgi:hypothetical protein